MFGATTGRAPTRCSQSTERSGAHHGHGWCTANFPLPWHPSRGRSRPPWAAQCEFQTAQVLLLPACQPVPSARCARCSPHHPFTAGAGTSRLRGAGWLEHTHSFLQLSPPSPRLTFLTPSIHQRLAARTSLHPSASIPADNSSSCPLQTPSTGTSILPVSTLLAWPRDWFEHLGAGGPREHSLNSPASPPLSRTKSSLSAI